jgi:hypothetical protein
MDADLVIMVAFCLEVFLFGLVAAVAVAGGVPKRTGKQLCIRRSEEKWHP